VRTFSGSLYDASGRRRVGEQELSCVVTDASDEATGTQAAICTRVARLFGYGELIATGAVTYRDAFTPNIPALVDDQAVVGGTRSFRGARGEVRYRTEGDSFRLIFRLLPRR